MAEGAKGVCGGKTAVVCAKARHRNFTYNTFSSRLALIPVTEAFADAVSQTGPWGSAPNLCFTLRHCPDVPPLWKIHKIN